MTPHIGTTQALQVDTITDALLGGCATVDRHGMPYLGSGVLVALDSAHHEALGRWLRPELTRMHVREWVRHVAPVVTAYSAGVYFGAWTDASGTLHLDVAQAFSELDDALVSALVRGEVAVYHAGRHEVIYA